MLPHIPVYSDIVECVKMGGTFLDVGCYCGTDLRRLVIDGCPQDKLYGIDLVDHWDLGFELFRDQEKFHATFYEGDILHPNKEMRTLFGEVDIVSAIHLLHNWNWETQVTASCQLSSFGKVGTRVVGYQIGTRDNEQARWDIEKEVTRPMWHTPQTFEKLWSEVGRITETRWQCDSVVRDFEELGHQADETAFLGERAGFLEFIVTRVL